MTEPEPLEVEHIVLRRSQQRLRQEALALSGGRCAIPECAWNTDGVDTRALEAAFIGTAAWNEPRKPRETVTVDDVVILCATHHRLVDADPHTYKPATLRTLRAAAVQKATAKLTAAFSVSGNAASGPMSVRDLLTHWASNRTNSSEEFWQQHIAANPIIAAAAVGARPFVLHDKCYVGGKAYDNKGGNVVDFIAMHQTNCTLVEIKTPTADLTGPRYRGNVYFVGKDVHGGLLQVLEQRRSLLESVATLNQNSPSHARIVAPDPRCVVIVGDLTSVDLNPTQTDSFELFRGAQRNVEIVTFDEVFRTLEDLANAMAAFP